MRVRPKPQTRGPRSMPSSAETSQGAPAWRPVEDGSKRNCAPKTARVLGSGLIGTSD